MSGKRANLKFAPLSGYKPMTSQRAARLATTSFHRKTGAVELKDLPPSKRTKLAPESEKEERGGEEEDEDDRPAYQSASALMTSSHRQSSRFVFQSITELGVRPKKGESPIKTLEIGAVNAQLTSVAFLAVDAIDVRSRHPSIREIDFFDFPITAESYDLIVCCMVLNCVADPVKRGLMLSLIRKALRPNGLFVFAIPSRCYGGKRADFEKRVLENGLGFEILKKEEPSSDGSVPKVAYTCLRAKRKVERREKAVEFGPSYFRVLLAPTV